MVPALEGRTNPTPGHPPEELTNESLLPFIDGRAERCCHRGMWQRCGCAPCRRVSGSSRPESARPQKDRHVRDHHRDAFGRHVLAGRALDQVPQALDLRARFELRHDRVGQTLPARERAGDVPGRDRVDERSRVARLHARGPVRSNDEPGSVRDAVHALIESSERSQRRCDADSLVVRDRHPRHR
jgi:hypothetical protein